jgi:hypothetical protein
VAITSVANPRRLGDTASVVESASYLVRLSAVKEITPTATHERFGVGAPPAKGKAGLLRERKRVATQRCAGGTEITRARGWDGDNFSDRKDSNI